MTHLLRELANDLGCDGAKIVINVMKVGQRIWNPSIKKNLTSRRRERKADP